MDGVIIIDKPQGLTSHDVVLQARRITGEKRIGHTGTLDPLATGVLVLCVGRATRIARYLEADDKEYQAVMRLGITTDTLDAEGRVLETKVYQPLSGPIVADAMNRFLGGILQKPPAFSAVKIKGTPSYKLARQGKKPESAARAVTISSIELTAYEDPFVRFTVRCSKGTYIRTLCDDIGRTLGMGAHLAGLRRTRSGTFPVEQSITLEQLSVMAREGALDRALVPMHEALSRFPAVVATPEETVRVMHGNRFSIPRMGHGEAGSLYRIQDNQGALLAIARLRGDELHPEIVFS